MGLRRGGAGLAAMVLLAGCAAGGGPELEPVDPGAEPVYLLIRSDDAGMSHAVNQATRRLIESGLPVSVSIMFPTPWWQEIVEILRDHPQVSVGIHTTLNSEWRNYRWGPIIGRTAAPSLVDDDGYFFHSARELYENGPDPAEVEAELRAQIDRAIATGLRIDYIDFHMGTVSSHPELMPIARRLADEYDLVISGANGEAFWSPQYVAEPAAKPDSLRAMVAGLAPGLNVVITHPGLDTPELAALEDMNVSNPLASMAMHRQGELDALLSDAFRSAVEQRRVRLITYRRLSELRNTWDDSWD
jgi:predicted glycoside hydrolase/deacetylase ChbG (UPF0249 family)